MALSYLFIWTKSATPQDITSNFSWEVGECVGGPCEEKATRHKTDGKRERGQRTGRKSGSDTKAVKKWKM